MIKKTKRKCSSCGGYCGGCKGSCKHAANELKKRTDQLWAIAIAGYENRKEPTND